MSDRMELLAALFEEAIHAAPEDRRRMLRRVRRETPTLAEELSALLRKHAVPGFLFEDSEGKSGSRDEGASGDDSELADAIDRTFASVRGAYRVRDVLGEGGMGIVYLAEQVEPIRRTVALKVLKHGLEEGDLALRFEVERQALALMDHPNIARVYEAGSTRDGRPYFAMEYVPGRSITEYCDDRHASVRERVELFLDVCAAVEHAHQKGIIHRDLKPSNILVRTDGEIARPKIIDFGIAKPFRHPLTARTLFTEHGTLLGSTRYMSPEQAQGQPRDIDTRTDVYSLSAILYELITGTLPLEHPGEDGPDLLERHRRLQEDDPPLLTRRVDALAPSTPNLLELRRTTRRQLLAQTKNDLEWVLAAGLERSPSRRYPTVSALAEDLRRWLRGEHVSVGRPDRWLSTRRLLLRHRTLVSSVAAVLVALTLGVFVSTYLYLDRRDVARVASTQRDQLLRLSDVTRLERAIRTARELVPAHPHRIPDFEAWLAGEASELADRLPLHRLRLTEIREILAGRPPGDEAKLAEIQFQHDVLSKLVADLECFMDPDPGIGARASVQRRLQIARSLTQRSILDHQSIWSEAIEAIADSTRSPRYRGLRLAPQMGLVPIGPDPRSGLWEFAVLASGAIPSRIDGESIRPEPRDGIVLVLVPGGRFVMGATQDESLAREFALPLDPHAADREGPPHWMQLAPFFISKYELTRGQWHRLTGRVARAAPTHAGNQVESSDVLPVEGVPRDELRWALRLAGLDFPTEAQWEYAARAGTRGVWWESIERSQLRLYGNLNDESARRLQLADRIFYEPWDDGFPFAAPVGRFRGNPFGLHDTIGNMWEWCLDRYASYTSPVAPETGLREGGTTEEWVGRGGDYRHYGPGTRSTFRQFFNAGYIDLLGARPARRIEPSAADVLPVPSR